MLNTSFYLEHLGLTSEDDMIQEFQDNLLTTNRSYNFFVDWEKARNHTEKYKYELNLLNSLVGTNNFEKEFKLLLQKYPEVVRAFPILIAMRISHFPFLIAMQLYL